MKFKSTFIAASLAFFAASTATAVDIEEQPVGASAEKTDTAETDNSGTKKSIKKKVKKHNHMEEKSGISMPEKSVVMDKHESMKLMNRHDHMNEKN